MSRYLRLRFDGPTGPTLEELRAVRDLTELPGRWTASEWMKGLRGVSEIALPFTDATLESLRSRGLRVEPVSLPRTDDELFGLLGVAAVDEGEIRWVVAPSFDPMLVLSARKTDGRWHLDLRRPRGSLLEPLRDMPQEPCDLAWRPLEVDVWQLTIPDDAELSSLVATWRAAPSSSPEMGCDGTSFSATTRTGSVVSCEHTWSPRRHVDGRGHAMAEAALAFARRFTEPDAAAAVATIGWRPTDG